MAQVVYKTIILFLLTAESTNGATSVIDKCTDSIAHVSQSADQEVTWLINIPTGDEHKFIRMQFKSLDTSPVLYDSIALHDGVNETYPLLIEIKANAGSDFLNIPFYTTGRSAFIRTKLGRRGFNIVFDCDKVVMVVNKGLGYTNFPGKGVVYRKDADMAMHFDAPSCNKIAMELTLVSIADDNITIYDGPNELAKEITTIKNGSKLYPFMSTGRSLFVRVLSANSTLPGTSFTVVLVCDTVEHIVSGNEGWIRYPQHGGFTSDLQEITWRITSPNGKPLRFYVTHMDDNPIDGGSLTIYDGSRKQAAELLSTAHISTSQIARSPFYTTGPTALITYSTDTTSNAIGFGLNFDTEKVFDVINSVNATVTYPEKGTYKTNEDVAWQLNSDTSDLLRITFTMLDIEADSDFVYIYDGPTDDAKLLAKVTNDSSQLNVPFQTSTNRAYLRFVSGSKSPFGRGISFKYNSPVKALDVDSNIKWLRFPAHGGLYSDWQSVGFRHSIPTGIFMAIRFSFLDLGENTTIRIYDGHTTGAPLIAEIKNDTEFRDKYLKTQGRHVLIYMKSRGDGSRHDGFAVVFEEIPVDERMSCSGVIKYPFGEDVTAKGVQNRWHIEAPGSLRLKLKFTYLDNFGDTWRLLVYDGRDDVLTPLLAQLEYKDAGKVPLQMYTTDLAAFVRFSTYFDMTSRGFELAYDCEHTMVFDEAEGWITHYQNRGQDVQWQINIPSGKPVRLYFTGGLSNFPSCGDVAYIYDGPSTSDILLATVRDDSDLRRQFFASASKALVRYVSTNQTCARGIAFFLTFDSERVIKNCTSGTIKYPKGDGHYPANVDVSYVITAPTGKSVKITFTKLDIENDFVEMRDGTDSTSPVIITADGRNPKYLNTPYYTETESAYLYFHTEGMRQGLGFVATYECGSAAWNVLRSSNLFLLVSLSLIAMLQNSFS